MTAPRPSTAVGPDGFAALADPTRREILALLAARDLTVKEIAASFEISRPAVSKHLRLLRRTGLVRETKVGRERIQRFDGAALRPVSEWVHHYERFWERKLESLRSILEEER
ncbi:MAG: metalloregulator ArsR/SmtB family transcription factor [Chloroflexota bacterium]|jgi:DNA-binding transcriptional ArsR family regulator|nr:metalloregulator ArsR/SmtB family transcription factor [Chloroflexota bacterium]MDH5242860.1 metalloregulator ArsR/SmtB family transcription factor [Chloroflexota bacterium]